MVLPSGCGLSTKTLSNGTVLEKRFAIDMMQGCECIETVLITDDLAEVQVEIKKLIEAGERLTGPIAEEYR
jgi:hypothetical protein